MKRPFLKAYPQSWFGDRPLRMCSLAARGLWWELCLIMHDNGEPYGHLAWTAGEPMAEADVLAITSGTRAEYRKLLKELESKKIFSRTAEGVIYSRKLVRDESKRLKAIEDGGEGGNPKLGIHYNRPGFVYAMRRDSDGRVKIGISANPAKRLHEVRQKFKGVEVEIIGRMATDDMGRTEAAFHHRFSHCKKGEWFALTGDEATELLTDFGEIPDNRNHTAPVGLPDKHYSQTRELPNSSSLIRSEISATEQAALGEPPDGPKTATAADIALRESVLARFAAARAADGAA